NLSMVVTAREMNPNLFIIVRQNHSDNSAIIEAVKADMVMHPSKIIADKIRVLLSTPLLYQFVSLAYYQDNNWACELVSRITALVGHQVPNLTEITIDKNEAQAVVDVLEHGETVKLADLQRDPWKRRDCLKCIVLMIECHNDLLLLPGSETKINVGDRLLVCAGERGFTRLRWNLQHDNILSYVRTGTVVKHGWLWEKLSRKSK
ncbi:MAG: potassium transporter TrkA, partial [Gammaproteobacteria bacterium]|nr:potassium transporter TrkA [Gammaproteobacteria bacterium]MBT6456190.1 potassium transporter TrkA [Gammaproteobacteria bacterium]